MATDLEKFAEDNGLKYFMTDHTANNERINIMPYSFTMIMFNEE